MQLTNIRTLEKDIDSGFLHTCVAFFFLSFPWIQSLSIVLWSKPVKIAIYLMWIFRNLRMEQQMQLMNTRTLEKYIDLGFLHTLRCVFFPFPSIQTLSIVLQSKTVKIAKYLLWIFNYSTRIFGISYTVYLESLRFLIIMCSEIWYCADQGRYWKDEYGEGWDMHKDIGKTEKDCVYGVWYIQTYAGIRLVFIPFDSIL